MFVNASINIIYIGVCLLKEKRLKRLNNREGGIEEDGITDYSYILLLQLTS